jgi:glycosyltransferase involved in cell wall biosynthesis
MNFNKFVFIIPSYNNSDWYEYNIKSIAKQHYDNWRAIYIDDASTDGTLKLVRDYTKSLDLTQKFTYIQNPKKLGPAGSRYQGYIHTYDDEICCMLDGDDWLYGDNVLDVLNDIYNDGYNCTYGSYWNSGIPENSIPRPPSDYSNHIHKYKLYRSQATKSFIASHLRTMKAYLIKDINPDKYLKLNNEWIKVCTDMAEMFYVLEKKETSHKFIQLPLYVYNFHNSIRYDTSYVHRDKDKGVREYRNNVMEFISNASRD